MNLNTKYLSKKATSKQRGIGFNLTFDEWFEIWDKSGYLDQYGLYVMSRYEDKGHYEKGNVFIQSRKNNSLDACSGSFFMWSNSDKEKSILMFYQGFKIKEISKITGKSYGSVKMKIYRNIPLSDWQSLIEGAK